MYGFVHVDSILMEFSSHIVINLIASSVLTPVSSENSDDIHEPPNPKASTREKLDYAGNHVPDIPIRQIEPIHPEVSKKQRDEESHETRFHFYFNWSEELVSIGVFCSVSCRQLIMVEIFWIVMQDLREGCKNKKVKKSGPGTTSLFGFQ